MVILYDDALARQFEPFATTRPAGELRAGALLTRERWAHVLGTAASGFISAPHLAGFAEGDAPPCLEGDLPAGTWVVNTRALPMLGSHPAGADVITVQGRVAAVRIANVISAASLAATPVDLDTLATETAVRTDVDGVWLDAVWDLVAHLTTLLTRDIPGLVPSLGAAAVEPANNVHIVGSYGVWAEPGATIEPMTVFDTTAGPVLLRRGSHVQAFTRVIGPLYLGIDSTITADRIAASSIGDVCRVHGELSTSILIGHANKGHDGFVGHSVLGRWVNLGAGTITSNLKNTYGSVALWTRDGVRETGQQFLGTLFGDHVKTGIGLRLTTGCVLGAGANVFDQMPPKAVAPFAWGHGAPYGVFAADKFVDTAARMMGRRGVTLTDDMRRWWLQRHTATQADGQWPR